MGKLGKHISYWIDSTQETNFPSLKKETKADVVVIGGGLVGITTGLLLQRAGLRVVILEAHRIVEGVTGFTTAKVTSAHGLIYKYLIDHFGLEKAQIYADANQSAIETIKNFVSQLKIDCAFERASAFVYALDQNQISQVKAEVEAAKKLKLPVSFTEKTDLPFKIAGAIKYGNQAFFHPRKYLLTLAKEFVAKGGRIFEETRAINIEEGKEVKVKTKGVSVSANFAVVASNYPIYDPSFFFTRLTPMRSYVLAAKINGKIPKGMYYSTEKNSHSVRSQPTSGGPILLLGGEGHKSGQVIDTKERYQNLEKWARENFDIEEILYHWSTQDNDTLDQVPFIGRISPFSKNIFVATGFKGWGMTTSTFAAEILADRILGKNNSWANFFDPVRFEGFETIKNFTKQNLNVAHNLIGGKIKKYSSPNLVSFPKDHGELVSINNETVALYRDSKGKFCPLSSVCTHLGCTVNFNNAEKSWDCPCHGSRFSTSGEVLHGPAVNPLEEKNLNLN